MFKRLALAALVLSLVPVAATAHGPTRQKVTQTVEINAPADKVWAVVGKFQDMGWTGVFVKTEGKGDNGAGAVRKLTTGAGGTIDEKLIKHDDAGKSYSYEITAVDPKVLPVANYSSSISVTGDASKATVQWKGAFYRSYGLNDPPPEENDEAAVKGVTGAYKAGLENLKKKMEAGG
jgi:Polyketide cyclase / dehydrase and lipid transport